MGKGFSGENLSIEDLQQKLKDLEKKYQKLQKDKIMLHSLLEKTSLELRRALEAERRFLAMFSHEIRTPLNSILGFIELLRETPLDQQQKKYINYAHRSAVHLLSLINKILDISKIEAGQLELTMQKMDIEELLHECTAIISPRIKEGVKLKTEILEFPFLLIGDPVRVKQIFLNLLGNAAKFTHKGSIVLRLDDVEDLGDKVKIRVSIQDTGMGIPKEKISEIFKPFKQINNLQAGGTGLGLYLSKSLAKLMGGDINVESEPGKGSIFTVELLLKKGPPKGKKFNLKGKSLAVITGEIGMPEFLIKGLRDMQMEVSVFVCTIETLPSVIKSLSNRYWDAVIMDKESLGEFFSPIMKLIKNKLSKTTILCLSDSPKECKEESSVSTLPRRSSLYRIASVLEENIRGKESALRDYSGLKILVVEDSEFNLTLMQEIFRNVFGVEIDLARNGKEAIEEVKRKNYHIVFMDVLMPEMNGLEATIEIRKFNKTVPIIGMSANAFGEDIEKGLKAGMNAYIKKPFKLTEIEQIIKKFCPHNFCPERHSPDKRIIKYFSSLFGEENAQHLLERAKENIESLIKKISSAVEKEDFESMENGFHSLKGVLLNCGLEDLAEISRRAELSSRKRNIEEIKKLWKTLCISLENF